MKRATPPLCSTDVATIEPGLTRTGMGAETPIIEVILQSLRGAQVPEEDLLDVLTAALSLMVLGGMSDHIMERVEGRQ